MAKPENPAETPVARLHRPVQRGNPSRQGAFAEPAALPEQAVFPERVVIPERAEVIPSGLDPVEAVRSEAVRSEAVRSEAFRTDASRSDTTRDLETPEMLADDDLHEEADDAPQLEYDEAGIDDALVEDALADHALIDHALIDNGVLDDEALEAASEEEERGGSAPGLHPGASRHPNVEPRPGLAWGRPGASSSRTPLVPIATLERPSSSRLELTPSPVPRVALAPATGAVDISLVPGPNVVGGRNLPTLAAQHLIGRRPRRPAPAVTVPPPAARSREPRSAFALARDVRSSKGEIVLGLTIGLGVSLLLAGLGQAYLRGDVSSEERVAEEEGSPVQLESVTLSARPEGAAAPAGASDGARRAAEATEPVQAHAASKQAANDGASHGSAGRDDDAALFAQAAVSKRSEQIARATVPQRAIARQAIARQAIARPSASARAAGDLGSAESSSGVAPPRAARARRPAPASEAAAVREGAAPVAAPSPGVAPAERAAAPAAPLTPAQSAGLGLDLPL